VNEVCSHVLDVVMSLQRGELSEAFAASLHLTAIRPGRVEWKYKEHETDVRTLCQHAAERVWCSRPSV
jgi:hypothetical protein